MVTRRSRANLMRIAFAMLLMAALSSAQWAGLKHGIAHGGWQQQARFSMVATGSGADAGRQADPDKSGRHSCAAFDAATLADSVHTAPFVLPLLSSAYEIAQRIAFTSWSAPCIRHFLSRAPPFLV